MALSYGTFQELVRSRGDAGGRGRPAVGTAGAVRVLRTANAVSDHALPLSVSPVRFEHHRQALGIAEVAPRLSWRVDAPDGWSQAGYEVAIGAELYRIDSGESVLVPWPAPPLSSRDRREVRVRVWGTDGLTSSWSNGAWLEIGLLNRLDWTARMIAPQADPAPMLRRNFRLAGTVVSAGFTPPRKVSTRRRSTGNGSVTTRSRRAGPPTTTGCGIKPMT